MNFKEALINLENSLSRFKCAIKTSEHTELIILGDASYKTGKVHLRVGLFVGDIDKTIWQFMADQINQNYQQIANLSEVPPIVQFSLADRCWGGLAGFSLDHFDMRSFLYEKPETRHDRVLLELDLQSLYNILIKDTDLVQWARCNPIAIFCEFIYLYCLLAPNTNINAFELLSADNLLLVNTALESSSLRDAEELEAMFLAYIKSE